MAFSSRACRTCKQRHVKCDETYPSCNRCTKAKLQCDGVQQDGFMLFLNENEYAGRRQKRPRGPNTKRPKPPLKDTVKVAALESQRHKQGSASEKAVDQPPALNVIPQAPSASLDDQAITYYSRSFVEGPSGLPELVDTYNKHAFEEGWYDLRPQTVLELAISAVSNATFGRAHGSQAALAAGCTHYTKALVKTNAALKDQIDVLRDEVLLSVMLLSFYENSVFDRTWSDPNQGLQVMASRSFAHHDGAMAMLKLRRHASPRTAQNLELDKLVRRQLLRTLILRTLPVPSWLRDGSTYGERGISLELDRCMVVLARLRFQYKILSATQATASAEETSFDRLLQDTQILNDVLLVWANDLPPDNSFSRHVVTQLSARVFENEVHTYATVGHAALWNRYRALRISANDIALKILLGRYQQNSTTQLWVREATSSLDKLYGDLCASVPYIFGLLEISPDYSGPDPTITIRDVGSLKGKVTAHIASFLAWPLVIALTTTKDHIPRRYRQYLKDRLIEVSEIVDDGVLERVATSAVVDDT